MLIPIYCFHCIATFKPKDSDVLREYAGSGTVKGKPVIVLDTGGIVPYFVRALNEATEVKMA
jgi:hypothetical protein